MEIIRSCSLVKKNSKNKIQLVLLELIENEDGTCLLSTKTGQRGNKQRLTEKLITEGKANRTIVDQGELMYNGTRTQKLNHGYKDLSDIVDMTGMSELDKSNIPESIILEYLGDCNTDTNGIPKPMLAIQEKHLSMSGYNKDWYCSRKLDGLRCLLYCRDGEIHSASRGGINYDISIQHITKSQVIIDFFKNNPDVILDGELFHKGIPLSELSGIVRSQSFNNKSELLEYWIYDYYSNEMFIDRYKKLMKWKSEYPGMIIIDHYVLNNYQDIHKMHDEFVADGFEGLVMRNPLKPYMPSARSAKVMVKVKQYQDAEFEVRGIKQGKNYIDDISFLCITKEGKEFYAKPKGAHDIKEYYVNNIDKLIGQKATVKYFDMSVNNIPTQTVFKCFRHKGE